MPWGLIEAPNSVQEPEGCFWLCTPSPSPYPRGTTARTTEGGGAATWSLPVDTPGQRDLLRAAPLSR